MILVQMQNSKGTPHTNPSRTLYFRHRQVTAMRTAKPKRNQYKGPGSSRREDFEKYPTVGYQVITGHSQTNDKLQKTLKKWLV